MIRSAKSRKSPRPMRFGAKALRDLRRGRAQRLLAAATAGASFPLAAEVFFNHYKGSFANKFMWSPVVLTPALGLAALGAVRSERVAHSALPVLSTALAANGILGTYFHLRGVSRKPGGLKEPLYNIVMGPPLLAPGSLTMVGGIGLMAAAMKRERP